MLQAKTINDLQKFLESEIPLLGHMGIQISVMENERLRLTAPLGPNSNHHGTGFGGSIATLGIAAGWALLHLKLLEEDGSYTLVIQNNETEYLAPVRADFEAVSELPDATAWQDFIDRLRKKGRARLEISATTYCQDEVVARHRCRYAAIAL